MSKCIHIIYVFIILSLFNCELQTNLEYEDFGYYKVLIPKSWKKSNYKNPDSQMMIWSNSKDSLIIEYGKFVSEFQDLTALEEHFEALNGYFVQKITSKVGIFGLFVGGNNAESSLKITYLSKDKNSATFQRIYSSLKINKNCFLGDNFGMMGQIIYKRECLQCHGDIKDGFDKIILSNLIKKKDDKWLTNWLRDKNFREANSTGSYESFTGIKDMDCGIKSYNNQELKSIISYLRSDL